MEAFTLWEFNSLLLKMNIEKMDLPTEHRYVNVYQRVVEYKGFYFYDIFWQRKVEEKHINDPIPCDGNPVLYHSPEWRIHHGQSQGKSSAQVCECP